MFDEIYQAINGVEVNAISSIYKLLLSMVLGSAVGYQRKVRGQSAGLRTFSLISMGAALAMILSIYVPQEYLGLKNGDPGRIAAQVVTGIGFLGAGAIIQMKGSVKGLTTAASIWMVATIGMAVGVGMYWISLVATLLILVVLAWLEQVERRINIGSDSMVIRVRLGIILEDIEPYRQVLNDCHVQLTHYYVDYDFENNTTHLNLSVLIPEKVDHMYLFKQLTPLFPTKSITLGKQLNI